MNKEPSWKSRLDDSLDNGLCDEIDAWETNVQMRRAGKIDEKVFAEARLRRGVYGQRYDNGERHDGAQTRTLSFPCGELTKGPNTVWDAPGMMRIKIPMGKASNEQLDLLAELAEEYSDAVLHVTTRQDIQFHFVHIEDTPDLMRRLASVGITTREACGNSVRNVTACQYAGACGDSAFDVTPYAQAATYFLLGHKDVQDFGRKFKIAFSGCRPHPCGMALFNDVGCIAVTRESEGGTERGFEFYVGGGLGAIPQKAALFDEFVPEDEFLPLCQAVCRVFSRVGERTNRARARLKFVIKKLGIEEFRRLVLEERKTIPEDERWTRYLQDLSSTDDTPAREARPLLSDASVPEGFAAWRRDNVWTQPQDNFVTATVRLPLGDISSEQMRSLTSITRSFAGDTVRLTVEQNIAVRFVSEADLPSFYKALSEVGLASPGASTSRDIVACPGTDTCKLGVSSSRGLAAVLEKHMAITEYGDPEVDKLHIKISGCFNSCSQHHVADIGFLGVARLVKGRRVAHFQLVVGGEWANNGGEYGLAIGAFPSKRIPQLVDHLVAFWGKERLDKESLKNFIARVGRATIKKELNDFRAVPDYDEDPAFYTDWGDAREYTIGDQGVGECAGEVVSQVEFGLQDAERQVFQAQVDWEKGSHGIASIGAFQSMLTAAKALVRIQNIDVSDVPNEIIGEFRTRFHDTKKFHDPHAGAKFANYLLKRLDGPPSENDNRDVAHEGIEEANLFIEAAHACAQRLQG